MIYRFSGIEIDTLNYQVLRDGIKVPVEPKVFDIILVLIQHHPHLVSREQLLDAVWGGKEICDANLTNYIKTIRSVLGDNGRSQRIIKTVRGRGYSLCVDHIECEQPQKNTTEQQKPALSINIFPYAATVISLLFIFTTWLFLRDPITVDHIDPVKKLAILPFSTQSTNFNEQYFSDGIHSDLLSQLTKITSISTISLSSVTPFRDSPLSVNEIANKLGVGYILTGSVRQEKNQLHIAVQLVDASNNTSLWANTYIFELDATELFAVQSYIAIAVSAALDAELSADDKGRLQQLPTQNMEALEAFFHAKALLSLDYTSQNHQKCVELLEQAIQLDPNYAQAHAMLAYIILDSQYYGGYSIEDILIVAKNHIDIAQSIQKNSPEAYVALARWHLLSKQPELASAAYESALSLAPNDARIYYSFAIHLLWRKNEYERALETIRKAVSLDPNSPDQQHVLADALMANGLFTQAQTVLNNSDLQQTSPHIQRSLSRLYRYGFHQLDKAILAHQTALNGDPRVTWDLITLASHYETLGLNARAAEHLRQAIEKTPEKKDLMALRGKVYFLLGEDAAALESFLKVPSDSNFFSHSIYIATQLCNKPVCADQLMTRIAATSSLLSNPAEVDRDNFTTAIALTKLMIQQNGYTADTKPLLLRALEASKNTSYVNWKGAETLWTARIHTALGEQSLALKEIESFVNRGGHNASFKNDPDFEPLKTNPRMTELLSAMDNKRIEQTKQLKGNSTF